MPRSASLALHGVNPNIKKIKITISNFVYISAAHINEQVIAGNA